MTDNANYTEFEGIIEHMHDPLAEKRATFYGALTGIIVLTWLAVIVPVVVMVWSAAF